MHTCDYCEKEIRLRHVFCCPSHKVMWHRDNKELVERELQEATKEDVVAVVKSSDADEDIALPKKITNEERKKSHAPNCTCGLCNPKQ